ncbi:cGMP-inhibited 3',5'-cyclic phosphodiesterase B, partial [Clarias magur]
EVTEYGSDGPIREESAETEAQGEEAGSTWKAQHEEEEEEEEEQSVQETASHPE